MSFATASDLGTLLKRSFAEGAEADQVQAILDGATAYLQSLLGSRIAAETVTFIAQPKRGEKRIMLPQQPVRLVQSVTIEGVEVEGWRLRNGAVTLDQGFDDVDVEITFTFGYEDIPEDLNWWCCYLASGVIAQIERSGSLSTAGIANERIDDYGVGYFQNESALQIPPIQLEMLQNAYGKPQAFVVDSQ